MSLIAISTPEREPDNTCDILYMVREGVLALMIAMAVCWSFSESTCWAGVSRQLLVGLTDSQHFKTHTLLYVFSDD